MFKRSEKDIKKDMKKLEKMEKELNDMANNMIGSMLGDEFFEKMDKIAREKFDIHVSSDGKTTSASINGGRTTLLINLAGLEKTLLNKMNCSEEEFDFFRHLVGGVEAFDSKEEYEKYEKAMKEKRDLEK